MPLPPVLIQTPTRYVDARFERRGMEDQHPMSTSNIFADWCRFDEQANAQRSMDLTVVDRCTGCQPTDLDTSLGAFEHVAAQASGRVDVTWAWLPTAATGS